LRITTLSNTCTLFKNSKKHIPKPKINLYFSENEMAQKNSRICSKNIPDEQDVNKQLAATTGCHWFVCYNHKCKFTHVLYQKEVRDAYLIAFKCLQKYSKSKQKTVSAKEITTVWEGTKPFSSLGNVCPWFNEFQADLQALSTSRDKTVQKFLAIIRSFTQNMTEFNKNVRYHAGKVVDKYQNVILDIEKKVHDKTTARISMTGNDNGVVSAKTSSSGYIPKETSDDESEEESNVGHQSVSTETMERVLFHGSEKSPPPGFDWTKKVNNIPSQQKEENDDFNSEERSVDQSVSTGWGNGGMLPMFSPPHLESVFSDSVHSDSVHSDSVFSDSVFSDSVPSDSVPSDSVPSDSALSDSAMSGFSTPRVDNYWKEVNEVLGSPQNSLQKQNDELIATNRQLLQMIARLKHEHFFALTRLEKEAKIFKEAWLDLQIKHDDGMTFA
jgi:hypothetical protein